MNKLLASLSFAFFSQFAHADVMTVDFTTHGGWTVPRTTVPSVGNLTLALNDDGTVDAQLNVAADQVWYGVAIDSGYGFNESNLSQGAFSAWGTSFGEFDTGILCRMGCTGSASWTISATDKLTSVQQLFNGTGSTFDGWFYTMKNEYAGMAAVPQAADVPEPASIALLGLGLAGVGVLRRRGSKGAKQG